MTTVKSTNYKVLIAGVGYGVGRIALKSHVIALDTDEAERLLGLHAVTETDEPLTVEVQEREERESAQALISKEEHAAKATSDQ